MSNNKQQEVRHRSTTFFVQSKNIDGKVETVGHSEDKETGEIYYKFFDRKKAVKLMDDEKKVSPEYKYRVVKQTTIIESLNWE